jgi:cell wall-associated NlpC family hydrolase
MIVRRLIGALFAFAVLGAAALAVAPSAYSPVLSYAEIRFSERQEGFAHRAPSAEETVVATTTPGELAAFFAVERVGVPYRYGGESPESGFDCSGLIRWSYARVGVDVPHNSHALYSVGEEVDTEAMRAGDVLFFEGLGHVGLYLGSGRMVHAPQTGKHVEIVDLSSTNYGGRLIGARRVAAT